MRPVFASLARAVPIAITALLAACGQPSIEPRYAPGAGLGSTITVTSHAFAAGTRIPVDHTCDGSDVMPELVISSPPEQTKSLVVKVEDPDTSSGVFTHMVAFNVSPDVRRLPSAPDLSAAGEAARYGLNDFGGVRYQGPCPPRGEAHRYLFRVYALDAMLTLPEGASQSKVDAGMDGHILGAGSLMGHFGH